MTGLSKKIRFEVFKRDKFTCQYCGRSAPEVTLQVDHIEPRAEGGSDELLNLTTSCWSCNIGKGARRLDDDSVVVKQRRQLEELQERQEQLEMMIRWQRGLADLESQTTDELVEFWCDLVDWSGVNASGRKKLSRWINKYGVKRVAEAMRKAAAHYTDFDDEGNPTSESTEVAFRKVGGVCHISEVDKEKPYLKRLFYIRGIVRNRMSYYDARRAREYLEGAFQAGCDPDVLQQMALKHSTWSSWYHAVLDYTAEMLDLQDEASA